jgi:mxaL protein
VKAPALLVFERESRPIVLALLLLLAALLMPTVNLPRATHDTIVVFDITQSMNVEDYRLEGAPVDRLTFARTAVRAALRELPCGSRVGWGAFAEYRTVLLLAPIEVCSNYSDLLATLDAIDGRMRWGNASEVTKGLFWALRVAQESGAQPNVIFLSDGHEAPPLRKAELPVFDDVKGGAIGGWILGVGGYEPRPIPKTDAEGKRLGFWRAEDVAQPESGGAPPAMRREHLSELREAHLQALAQQTGLRYAHLTGPASVLTAMHDTRHATRRAVPTELGWLPALAALALLAWHFRPSTRR